MKNRKIGGISFFLWSLTMGIFCVNVLFAEEMRVFFGSYDRTPETRGIYVSTLNETDSSLTVPQRAANVSNPGFLIFAPDCSTLYAVCGEKYDSLAAFRVEPPKSNQKTEEKPASAILSELNRLTGIGSSVCHLTLTPEAKHLLTANYSSADFALFSLKDDASLDREIQRQKLEGSGPNPQRQTAPHPHSVKFGRENVFYVPDLGTDKIMIYRFDAAKGAFTPNDSPFAESEPGSGPRHLCLRNELQMLYAANELTSTVTAFHIEKNGTLKPIQTISTLPHDQTSQEKNTVAEIAATPDGRFLYVSNRGHDSIACFKIEQDGTLTLREIAPVHGKNPRHFAISPTGKHLVSANQGSDSVSLFAIHPDTGKLKFLSEQKLPVSPVCVLFEKVLHSFDAEAALEQLKNLKSEKSSPNWNFSKKYPWDQMLKKAETLTPQEISTELILARLSVETLEELQQYIFLSIEMEKKFQEGEERDLVRDLAIGAISQRSELLVSRFSSVKIQDLKILAPILETSLKHLETAMEWVPSSPSLNLCRGWMTHYLSLARQKGAEEYQMSVIQDSDAKKFINAGIEFALNSKTTFENVELLSESVMARATWNADENPETALEDMKLASTINPQMKDQVHDTQMVLFLHTQKYEEALALLNERIEELDEQLSEANSEEKEALLEKINPLLLKFQTLKVELLVKLEKYEDALSEVEKYLKGNPKDVDLLTLKFQTLVILERFEPGLEVLEILIEENPLNPAFYLLSASAYAVLEQPEKALEKLNQAIELTGNSQELWAKKIALLIELERFDEAMKEVDEQIEKDSENVFMYVQKGYLLIEKKKYTEARQTVENAEKIVQKLLEESADAPSLDFEEEEETEATPLYLEEQSVVYQFLANFHLMAGSHTQALAYYEKCLELDDSNSLTLNNLAWLLATSPDDAVRNGKKAVELAKKAVELTPIAGYLSTLAAAYAETGDFEKANQTIQEALEMAKEDAETLESLKEEKANYDAKKPTRERTEKYLEK